MRWYLAVVILVLVFSSGEHVSAASFSPGDIEWGSASTATLFKDQTISAGNFSVKAVQFSSPVPGIKDINGNIIPETDVDGMVFLEVYRDGTLIKEIVMSKQSDPYIDPDYEVKISATDFPARNSREWVLEYYKPWATISVQLRALPKLEITVTTEKSTYTSYNDKIITVTVTVKNSGNAFAKNVDVNLNIGNLMLRGGDASQLHQNYYKMSAGASQSYNVVLIVPQLFDPISYNLSADAKGYDAKELLYKATPVQISITVQPKLDYFTISKAVRDRMYLQNTAMVRINIANSGTFDIYNLYINDSMESHFELKSNTSLQWYVPVLKSGQEWGTTYSIKPFEANINGFTLPPVYAQFTANNRQYNVSSQATTVIVNGPKIILNKTVNKPVVNLSEDVNVTVSVNNEGNIGTRVEIQDSLPEGVSLVSGPTSMTNWSDPNMLWGFSYTIRMNNGGDVELPSAVANYIDVEYRGTTRAVKSSGRPIITVVDLSKIPPPLPNASNISTNQTSAAVQVTAETPEPTPTSATPGFDLVYAAVVLTAVALYKRK